MGSLRLIARSFVHYRRAHLGLIIGTALAAAILTGALAVGDSVNHTLRTYALQRLGSAAIAVVSADRMFSTDLTTAMQEKLHAPVAGVFALQGMAIYQGPDAGSRKQVNKVQALGVDEAFWKLSDANPVELGRREAALNEPLAEALGAKVGDTVALRIAKPGLLSRDAPLSSREEESSTRANFTVKAIVSGAQFGRFSLAASQLPPANFFVNIGDLQQLADSAGRANLMLIGAGASLEETTKALGESWNPAYAGMRASARDGAIVQLESDRIFFDDVTAKAALALPGADGTLTYLVNSIRHDAQSTPYSFMTAGGPLTGDLGVGEIAINQWLADQLAAQAGDTVTVAYYEVTPSNTFEERSRDFTVKRVVSMDDLAQEKALVPEFPGLSNVESCKDWKIGMPMDEKLLEDKPNEAYWEEYKDTPKAFVTLSAGQSMWANRFGSLTAVRYADTTPDAVMAGLAERMKPQDVGLDVRNVREDAVAAVNQATDLGGLFLGLSFFLLISALILTGLLYAFGTQQRAEELGILSAVGYTKGRIYRVMLGEAFLVALPGSALGAVFGMGYAWALMIGLAHYWQSAVGRIPILFATTPMSIAAGVVCTILCALVIAALTLRRLLKHSISDLVKADFTQESRVRSSGKIALASAIASIGFTVLLVVYGLVSPPADPAEIFFSSGALALIGGLLIARHLLSRSAGRRSVQRPTTSRLALLNATRRRGRSLGIVSSLAAGGFMVLAVSSMQVDVGAHADQRWSGTGGFALYADATVPILDPTEIDKAAPGVTAHGIRVLDGDDASCLNLNHAIRPRVLGVNVQEFTQLKAFVDDANADLWELLDRDLGDGTVPALVGDSDTAMWTLKKKTGVDNGDTLAYTDESGRDVSLKLVGKLPMRLSVFQGTVLVSAKNFTKLWPSQEGFRVFLVDAPANGQAEVIEKLRNEFDRHGLDVATTIHRLETFHAVEGTYLSMFLVLGGVGLLLGASATGVVVLRNLLERRREIALLRAVGFSPRAIVDLLAYEYGLLLMLGTLVGAIASAVAMVPALTSSHADSSPLWRFGVLVLVVLSALLCAAAAIAAGLRQTGTADLRAE